MKKTFSNLAILLFSLMFCLLIMSCSDDDNDGNSNVNVSSANCDCETIIAQLTEQVEQLEARLDEVEDKTNDIENNLDYEIISQKLGNISICNCSTEIEEINNQLAILGASGSVSLPLSVTMTSSKGSTKYDFEFDKDCKLIKVVESGYESGDYVGAITYVISYEENQCMVDLGESRTFTCTFSDEIKNNYSAMSYYMIDYFLWR